MHQFSRALIQYTIHYFKSKYDHHITEDEAELYLNQMANLFEAFKQLLEEQSHQTYQDTTDGATLDIK